MPDIEKDKAFIEDESVYGKVVTSVPRPERKKDVDLDNRLYDNILGASLSSQLDLNNLNGLNTVAENRNQMYNIYDAMCEDGTISAVVETYAEDATERNESGNIMWVEANDSNVAKMVEYFLDTLNVNKNVYKWVHSLCKYGDLYLRLYRNSEYEDQLFSGLSKKETLNEDIKIKAYKKTDGYAHYIEMVSNPAEMFELTKFGKTVGYVQAPVTNTIIKNDNNAVNTFTYSYNFKRDDITVYPATEFVHATLDDDTSREAERVNIFLNTDDYEKDSNALSYRVRKGSSLLANVYKVWRELQLLENSVLLNRITKSSIVRMINVEVGDMPKENVTKTLMGIKQMIEQKAAIDRGNGMVEYTNPGPIENNVYVPTHEGVGAITTTQIGGDVDVKGLADLDYYMNKMYGQLRVPKQYFSQTDDGAGFNGGASLSIISSRYAKMVKRIQNAVIQAVTDAINLMLIDKNLDSYVNEFTIHMLPPTTQEEIDRRDNLSSKVQLTTDIMGMLEDIDDPVARLKILKCMIGNIVDDTDIISVIQEQIDKLESEESLSETENDVPAEEEDMSFSDDFSSESSSLESTMGGSINDVASGADIETPQEDNTRSDNTLLPSPEELGVDLDDSDTE